MSWMFISSQILTIAVLAILIAAPIGSIFISMIGPRLLHRTIPEQPIGDDIKKPTEQENGVVTNYAAEFEDETFDQPDQNPVTSL